MNISDNMLSAFLLGKTTSQEDLNVFNEMLKDENLLDTVDCLMELSSISDLNELRENFDTAIDNFDNYKDFNEFKKIL